MSDRIDFGNGDSGVQVFLLLLSQSAGIPWYRILMWK
jgi:hypothetical protein